MRLDRHRKLRQHHALQGGASFACRLAVSIVLLSGGSSSSIAAQTPPAGPSDPGNELTAEQRLERARSLFEYGDCAGVVDVTSPLAVPGKLGDERKQLEVHRMRGVCLVLIGRELEAAREFSSLLSIDPDAALDPFLTPPTAIEVFERQRTATHEQLEEIRAARERARLSGLDADGGVLLERTTTVRDVPLATALLPFGVAQAANGETAKAIAFGSVQGSLLAVNVGAYWWNLALKNERLKNREELTAHRVLWFAHWTAALGLALAYGAGVADALWNREDQVVIDERQSRRPLTPGEVKKLRDVPLKAAAPPDGQADPASPTAPNAPSPLPLPR
jgi:hypothetical protein